MTTRHESSTPTEPAQDTGPEPAPEHEVDENLARALAAVTRHVDEIRGQIDRLLNIRLDRARLKLRESVLGAVLWVLALGTVLAAVVVAVLHVVSGLSDGLTLALNGRAWAGDLLGGLIVLVVVWATVSLVLRRRGTEEMRKLVAKYRQKKEGDR